MELVITKHNIEQLIFHSPPKFRSDFFMSVQHFVILCVTQSFVRVCVTLSEYSISVEAEEDSILYTL
jgi:hypothetical protein